MNLIEQIHKEINQFRFEFSEKKYSKSNARKLFELGFKNHPITNSVRDEISESLTNKVLLKLHKDYCKFLIKYPNSLIILESEIEKIKDKFDLDFKSPLNFIGDIPEKNLKDILSFNYPKGFEIMILGTKNQFKKNIGGEQDPVVFLKLSEVRLEEVVCGEVFREDNSLYLLITMWGDEKSITEFNIKNN